MNRCLNEITLILIFIFAMIQKNNTLMYALNSFRIIYHPIF